MEIRFKTHITVDESTLPDVDAYFSRFLNALPTLVQNGLRSTGSLDGVLYDVSGSRVGKWMVQQMEVTGSRRGR